MRAYARSQVTPRQVVRIDAAGRRTVLPTPPIEVWRLAAGPGGTLWAASGGYGTSRLARWDGTLWITTFNGDRPSLYRYADGRWTDLGHDAWTVAVTPSGLACVTPGVACFDARGLVRESLPGVVAGSFDIAPDGTPWMLGEQLVRLPDAMVTRGGG